MPVWVKGLAFDIAQDEEIDYVWNLSGLIGDDDVQSVDIEAEGVSVMSSLSGKNLTVWVSDGVNGSVATVKIKITTNNITPRVFVRTVSFIVDDR